MFFAQPMHGLGPVDFVSRLHHPAALGEQVEIADGRYQDKQCTQERSAGLTLAPCWSESCAGLLALLERLLHHVGNSLAFVFSFLPLAASVSFEWKTREEKRRPWQEKRSSLLLQEKKLQK